MKGLRILLLWLCCGFALASSAREYSVREVPNTRYYSDTIHISDPDDWILPEYEAKIDHVLSAVRDEADVFVVVLSSIGAANIEEFANELFNFWGIGERERNNGVLMLMVEDQHKLRFETGYGMEETMPDALCLKIFNDIIRPYFKEGDYNEGLYAGVCAVAGILGGLPEDAAVTSDQLIALKNTDDNTGFSRGDFSWKDLGFFEWAAILVFLGIIVLFFFLFIKEMKKNLAMLQSDDENQVEKAHESIKKDLLALAGSLVFCTPLFVLFPVYLTKFHSVKRKYRTHPRTCTCGHEMRLLSEQEEDAFLSENQVFEEKLKVKDYDVWYCDACHSTKILGFTNLKAGSYYVCPSCHCLSGKNKRNSTVVQPTTSSSGEGLHHVVCKKCGHEYTIRYYIAPLKSSSGSSYGGDSGGSFGGGSSGGGGATGSW